MDNVRYVYNNCIEELSLERDMQKKWAVELQKELEESHKDEEVFDG